MTRWLTIAVAVAAFALVGAGCGGDDDASGDTDTIVATDTTLVSCAEAVAEYQKLMGIYLTAAGPTAEAEGSVELFQAFADDAPEEIRDDAQVIAEALAEYLDATDDIDLDTGETPSAEQRQERQEASDAVAAPEVLAAAENFFDWEHENC